MLKKIVTISAIASTLLFSQNLDIKKGWNNVGFSSEYSVQDIAQGSQNLKRFWYFDPVNKTWNFYSQDSSLMQTANSAGYSQIPQTLPLGSGIWVLSDNNVSLSVDGNSFFTDNTFRSFNSTFYGDTFYAIGSKQELPFLATSKDNSNWENIIPINLNENNQAIKGYSNADIFARAKDDLLFSFITQDANDSNNKTAWVGSYKDGNVVSKNILNVTDGYISNYWYGIFTSPESNLTQYTIFKKDSWNENEKDEIAIATKEGENDWTILQIQNGRDIQVNYDYISRDNASEVRVLKGLNITTYDPYKTLIYSTHSGLHKSLDLNGTWNSLTKFKDGDNKYIIMAKSNYGDWGRDGKHLAVIINNKNVDYVNMDHIIRAIGIVYSNNSSELYAFAHDEIGGTLYIYKSTDDGKTWSNVKEIENFAHQINYVINIGTNEDGVIHCRLETDYYNNSLESNDSFATWNEVKENYRIINNAKNDNQKFIKRVEPDGSITLIKRR